MVLGRYDPEEEDDVEARHFLAMRLLELAEEELGRMHPADELCTLAAAPGEVPPTSAPASEPDPAFLQAERRMREKLIDDGLKKVQKLTKSKAGLEAGGRGLDGGLLSDKWLVNLVNGRAGRDYATGTKPRGMQNRKPVHESDEEMSDEEGCDTTEGAAEAAAADEKEPRKRRKGFGKRAAASLCVDLQYTCELCGSGMRLTSLISHRLGPQSCVRHPQHSLNSLPGLPKLLEASQGAFAELSRSSSGCLRISSSHKTHAKCSFFSSMVHRR